MREPDFKDYFRKTASNGRFFPLTFGINIAKITKVKHWAFFYFYK